MYCLNLHCLYIYSYIHTYIFPNLLQTLLNPNAIKEVYLAVGSLVSKYCQRHGCNNGEVDAISKKFTESLKHCKANTKKDEERVLYILKGIGNTHHLASGVAASLTECVAQGRANRMRVAALQAFSAASCDANLQKKALELLADRSYRLYLIQICRSKLNIF